MLVRIHDSRAADILILDHLTTDPCVPITVHRDIAELYQQLLGGASVGRLR
jgi:hypothetical protein